MRISHRPRSVAADTSSVISLTLARQCARNGFDLALDLAEHHRKMAEPARRNRSRP